MLSGSGVLAEGYAIAQSNGGHIGTSAVDTSFAAAPYLADLPRFGSNAARHIIDGHYHGQIFQGDLLRAAAAGDAEQEEVQTSDRGSKASAGVLPCAQASAGDWTRTRRWIPCSMSSNV